MKAQKEKGKSFLNNTSIKALVAILLLLMLLNMGVCALQGIFDQERLEVARTTTEEQGDTSGETLRTPAQTEQEENAPEDSESPWAMANRYVAEWGASVWIDETTGARLVINIEGHLIEELDSEKHIRLCTIVSFVQEGDSFVGTWVLDDSLVKEQFKIAFGGGIPTIESDSFLLAKSYTFVNRLID